LEATAKAISERQRGQEGKGAVGRDRWQLISRWLRKIGGHTMTRYLCQEGGQCSSPWRFSDLLVD